MLRQLIAADLSYRKENKHMQIFRVLDPFNRTLWSENYRLRNGVVGVGDSRHIA